MLVLGVSFSRIFYFLVPFLKKIHKYALEGKISKFGHLAQRHRCWRRSFGLDADMTVTWQAARRHDL